MNFDFVGFAAVLISFAALLGTWSNSRYKASKKALEGKCLELTKTIEELRGWIQRLQGELDEERKRFADCRKDRENLIDEKIALLERLAGVKA